MKTICVLFVVAVAAWSCKDDKKEPKVCGYDSALDIPWLKVKIAEQEKSGLAEYAFLEQAEYNGSYLFWFNSCCPMCDIYPQYQDCDGNKIENPDFNKVTNRQVIWKGPDIKCQF